LQRFFDPACRVGSLRVAQGIRDDRRERTDILFIKLKEVGLQALQRGFSTEINRLALAEQLGRRSPARAVDKINRAAVWLFGHLDQAAACGSPLQALAENLLQVLPAALQSPRELFIQQNILQAESGAEITQPVSAPQ
jgi:hypothetical protein